MKFRLRPRSVNPSIAIALVALFVSLSGTAVAAGVVPLAKRALVADNAKKLGGKTAKQVAALAPAPPAQQPPTVTLKTQPWTLAASGQQDFTTICDGGQKAVSGGYDNPTGVALAFDSRPSADGGSWRLFLSASSGGTAAGTLYAVCVS